MKKNIMVVGILAVFIVIHVWLCQRFLLVDPPIFPDETYFTDVSLQQNNTGILSLSLYSIGIGQPHIRAYSYPPLYQDILSLWITLFGPSIEALRSLSVIISVFVLSSFFVLFYTLSSSIMLTTISTATILLYGPFGTASRIARMDMFVLLGLAMGLFILSRTKRSYHYMIGSGLCATMAWLSHPSGALVSVILLITGLYLYPKHMRVRFVVLFGLPIVLGTIWWFVRYSDRFDLFLEQMNLQVIYKLSRESIVSILFRSDIIWRIRLFFLLFFSSMFMFLGINKKLSQYIFAGITSWLMIIGVYSGVEQWYLLFLPFPFLVGIAVSWKQHKHSVLFISAVGLCLLNGVTTIPYLRSEVKTNESYRNFVEEMIKVIPFGSKIVVSSLPDPTFELWKQGYSIVHAVPHVSRVGDLKLFLASYDVLIINYATNNDLKEIINNNEYKNITFNNSGYQINVIYLK